MGTPPEGSTWRVNFYVMDSREEGQRAAGWSAPRVGDFHTPNTVSWALAGEARADDTRMLELLEPYRGQRARVVRLLELAGVAAPRFGPRHRPRSIAAI